MIKLQETCYDLYLILHSNQLKSYQKTSDDRISDFDKRNRHEPNLLLEGNSGKKDSFDDERSSSKKHKQSTLFSSKVSKKMKRENTFHMQDDGDLESSFFLDKTTKVQPQSRCGIFLNSMRKRCAIICRGRNRRDPSLNTGNKDGNSGGEQISEPNSDDSIDMYTLQAEAQKNTPSEKARARMKLKLDLRTRKAFSRYQKKGFNFERIKEMFRIINQFRKAFSQITDPIFRLQDLYTLDRTVSLTEFKMFIMSMDVFGSMRMIQTPKRPRNKGKIVYIDGQKVIKRPQKHTERELTGSIPDYEQLRLKTFRILI